MQMEGGDDLKGMEGGDDLKGESGSNTCSEHGACGTSEVISGVVNGDSVVTGDVKTCDIHSLSDITGSESGLLVSVDVLTYKLTTSILLE